MVITSLESACTPKVADGRKMWLTENCCGITHGLDLVTALNRASVALIGSGKNSVSVGVVLAPETDGTGEGGEDEDDGGEGGEHGGLSS